MNTSSSASPGEQVTSLLDKARHVIGLDLVFSGLTGYAVSKYDSHSLLAYGLLNKETSSSSDAAEKIRHSAHLTEQARKLFEKARPAICCIEKPEWHQKVSRKDHAAAGRERNAMKSLALSRGLAVATALCIGDILPVYFDVAQVRQILLGNVASKEAMFGYINRHHNLGLDEGKDVMNVTDAIALVDTFAKIVDMPAGYKWRNDLFVDLKVTEKALKIYQKMLSDLFGTATIMEIIQAKSENPELYGAYQERARQVVADGMIKGCGPIKENGNYFLSIDISARHPGMVVSEIETPDSEPSMVFQKTYALDGKIPDILSVYEVLCGGNILLAVTALILAYQPKAIIFEYSDWHRTGFGTSYHIDIKAIDYLFYTYGVLMAQANLFGLPLYHVNATDAKKLLLGKRNATKDDVKAYIVGRYPALKNEHTRDAALLLEYWLKTRGNTVNLPAPAKKKPKSQKAKKAQK